MDAAVRVAGCVLRDDKDRILLLHRNTKQWVHWELPGGKVEPGEDPAAAAAREIAEELDIEACNLVKLGGAELRDKTGQAYRFSWFLADCAEGRAPRIAEPHIFDDLRYFSVGELVRRDDLSINMDALLSQIQSKQVTL